MAKSVIFGVKSGDTYHYIGKTVKLNPLGNVNKSDVSRQYRNKKIREVFQTNNITIENLVETSEEWYDEKLLQVVDKYKKNNPLQNAQWMLDGKRGYWQDTDGYWIGKTRDANTIKQLSISKYINILQYDSTGKLIKTWKGAKEVAIQIFKDYKVKKGSGETKLYDVLNSKCLKGRFRHGSYWFRESDAIKYFGLVPKQLHLKAILEKEKQKKAIAYRDSIKNRTTISRYSVEQTEIVNGNKVVTIFDSAVEAALYFKVSIRTIQKLCRGSIKNSCLNLAYGKKIAQPMRKTNIDYAIQPLEKIKKIHYHTKTTYSIEQIENDAVVNIYDSVKIASTALGIREDTIRLICNGKVKKPVHNLVYGKKIKIFIKK